MTNTDNDVNQIIEKLEAQTLESRKRLDTIQEVEQENLKFNRALRKLYNELTRERETELNKAREEAKEIVDMALLREWPYPSRPSRQIPVETTWNHWGQGSIEKTSAWDRRSF